jgi:hypothetical protein
MREHPLAMLDFTPAEAARVGPVQARRMALEPNACKAFGARAAEASDKPDDHDADDTPGS